MKFFVIFCLAFSTFASAEVSPENVSSMLDQMVKENVISKDEAAKARYRMLAMNNDQWSEINKKAMAHASRGPASIAMGNQIENVNSIDLDGEQFKTIQNDLRKIVPQYHD